MKHMKQWLRITVVAGTLALGSGASAQYTNPYTGNTFNNPASSFIDTILLHNMQRQQLMSSFVASNSLKTAFQRGGQGRKLSPRERMEADRFAKYRGTMFTPSKQPLMPAKIAASFIEEPGEKQKQMTALFTKLLEIYNQRSREQNAPPNDVARTLAYCIAVNYSHYSGKDISMDHLAALRGKIRTALAGDAKFRALSNAKKQEMSETLIILTNFMDVGHTFSIQKKNQQAIDAYRQMAGMMLKGMLNVEPDRVAFSQTGLVIHE